MRLPPSLHLRHELSLAPQGAQHPPIEPGRPEPGAAGQQVPSSQPTQGQPGPMCGTEQMLLIVGMIAIFYFLILRPQQRQEKQRRAMLATVKKGDRVVTSAGIHGIIASLADDTVGLKLHADGKPITVDRSAIARVLRDEGKEDKPSAEPQGMQPGMQPAHLERGAAGEQLAAAHLEALGYRCLARNLRTRCGELDLVVRRGRLLAAVEVKTRSLHPAPERLVEDRALARLRRALAAIAPLVAPRCTRLRVDVVAVCWHAGVAPDVRHFPGTEFDAPRITAH